MGSGQVPGCGWKCGRIGVRELKWLGVRSCFRLPLYGVTWLCVFAAVISLAEARSAQRGCVAWLLCVIALLVLREKDSWQNECLAK